MSAFQSGEESGAAIGGQCGVDECQHPVAQEPEDEQPNIIARARFGRIAIANSDSGAAAYTDSAIDQAYRAVQELSQL